MSKPAKRTTSDAVRSAGTIAGLTISSLVLGACYGPSGTYSSTPTSTPSPTPTPTPTPSCPPGQTYGPTGCHVSASDMESAGVIQGLASDGHAIANATVEVMDANGRKLVATTAADGTFWFASSELAFPLVVQVTDPQRPEARWIAVTAAAPDALDTRTQLLNVNPLTTAQAALLTASGQLSELADPASARSLITPAALALATSKLAAILAPTLELERIVPSTFDPRNAVSTSTYQGLNALLLDVTVETADSTVLRVNGMPEALSSRTLMRGTTAVPVTPPPVSAHYLATIQQQTRPTVSVATWGTPRTIQFLAAQDGHLWARVSVPYQTVSGLQAAYTVNAVGVGGAEKTALTTPDGNWQIIAMDE